MKKYLLIISVTAFFLISCTSTGVQRIDPGSQADLSGYWNDNDVREVCEALIRDLLNSARVERAVNALGGRTPRVLVGRFTNESSEHINTDIISTTMETTIFNTGRMDFVAGGRIREELRAERQDQLLHASDDTMAALGNETGADFMLFGSVRTIVDRAGNQTIRSYFVSAEMVNLSTGERVWMAQNNDIVKSIVRPRNRL